MKASDIRRGHVIMVDGQPCRVMDFQHRTPGNLRAFVQVRLRNLTSGNTFDTRLSATEFVDDARLDTKELQVLYRDGNGVHVMDANNYEQYSLDEELTGERLLDHAAALRDDQGRAAMGRSARQLARPEAAQTLAEVLLAMSERRPLPTGAA